MQFPKGPNKFPSKYIIAGPADVLDNEVMYWSNEDGWTDKDSATIFTVPQEHLPIETSAIEEVK